MRSIGVSVGRNRRHLTVVAAMLVVAPGLMHAQQGGRGAGRGPAGPPPTGKSQAPIDLTGYWVSEIVDEWRFRVSPIKGDILYMPLNNAARQVANAWDPDKDTAEGNQCKAYGAVGLMQRPGRLPYHVGGRQYSAYRRGCGDTDPHLEFFGTASESPGPPSLQGYSVAKWEGPGFEWWRAWPGRSGGAAQDRHLECRDDKPASRLS